MTHSSTIREYPSTSDFPSHPAKLDRSVLESSYLELRKCYKGLSISRGIFASKTRDLQHQLEVQNQELDRVLATLAEKAQEKLEIQAELTQLEAVSLRQKELINEVKTEFLAVRDDRGNIIEKFNRMMRAVYRLLYQDIGDVFRGNTASKEQEVSEDWTDETPRNIGRSLLDK